MEVSVSKIKEIVASDKVAHVKYVRVKNEFRYAIVDGVVEHQHLLKEGEIPLSAGFFSFSSRVFLLHPMPSMTLNLSPIAEDETLLKTIFLGE